MNELNFDSENEKILKQIEAVNNKFADLLTKYIVKFSNKGVLESDNSLATLEQDLIKILKDAGYSEAVDRYFQFFNQILSNSVKNYSHLAESEQTLRESNSADIVTKSTIDALRKAGIQDNFINPLAKQIRTLILTGSTYQDFTDFLKNGFETNPTLTNYVETVTYDTFKQYDGALQNELRQKFNPTKFYYIGQDVEGSRPFCIDMHNKFGSNPITIEELKTELDEYCPNGVPSEDEITITTPLGHKKKVRKKGAGMIEPTNVSNFEIVTGGHRCNHKVRWIFD